MNRLDPGSDSVKCLDPDSVKYLDPDPDSVNAFIFGLSFSKFGWDRLGFWIRFCIPKADQKKTESGSEP